MSQKSFLPAGRVVGLADLRTKMATANDLAYHAALTSDPAEFQAVMEALHEAYWIAAALASRCTRTGCAEHPHGPVDPEAPDGWGQCLLCNSRRCSGRTRRALRMVGNGEHLTGATSQMNRPQVSLDAGRRPARRRPGGVSPKRRTLRSPTARQPDSPTARSWPAAGPPPTPSRPTPPLSPRPGARRPSGRPGNRPGPAGTERETTP
ncbi:hypothetical protein ACIRST_39080 [Kitasatospora sp. NPDC101447]|uniref:hypothetical protein n=1 Tax=Kitasatospora sp. NPDC101447 TaxID=3364102 RepID=UPI00382363E2